jgi:hypothetical protein
MEEEGIRLRVRNHKAGPGTLRRPEKRYAANEFSSFFKLH